MDLDAEHTLGAAADFLLGSMLIVAALSKLVSYRRFITTIAALRIPKVATGPAALFTITTELVAGGLLLLAPGSPWGVGAAALLATSFAIAGGSAAIQHQVISCQCFGGLRASALGWQHAAALMVWFPLLACVRAFPPHWSVDEGLALAAVSMIVAALVWLTRERPQSIQLPQDRLHTVLPVLTPSDLPSRRAH